jgi:hypothetical protein
MLGAVFVLIGLARPALHPGEGRLDRISGTVGQSLYGESPGRSDDGGGLPAVAGLVFISGGALFGAIAGAVGGGARGGARAGAVGGGVLGSGLLAGCLRMGEFAAVEQVVLILIIPAVALIGWLFGATVGSILGAMGPRSAKPVGEPSDGATEPPLCGELDIALENARGTP